MNNVIRGYATVRPFGGYQIPVPVQNLVMRNYASNLGLNYILPMNEHKFEGCFMQLFATLHLMERLDRLVMCSASMLPLDRALRSRLFEIAKQKQIEFHFPFENLILSTNFEFEKLEEINLLRGIADEVDRDALALVSELSEFLVSQ